MIALPRRGIARPPLNEPFRLNRNSSQADGLAGWWPSRYPGANVLPDMSGHGHDATFPGGTEDPAWIVDGERGNVLNSDGSDDYITVPNIPQIQSATQFSFTAWVYVDAYVLGKYFFQNKQAFNKEFHVSTSVGGVGGADDFYLLVDNLGAGYGYTDNDIIVYDQWTHIATVIDLNGSTDADKLIFYYNGIEQTLTYGGTFPATLHSESHTAIMHESDGYQDDSRVYNRALSAVEVWQIYDPLTRWDLYDTSVLGKQWVVVDDGENTGVLDATFEDDSLSAVADLDIDGVLDATLADDTLSSVGDLDIDGALDATLDNDALSATSELDIDGILDATLDDDTLAATGDLDTGNEGALDVTLEDDTLAAVGTLALAGLLSQTLDNDTLSGIGRLALTGALAVTMDDDTLEAIGGSVTATMVAGTIQGPGGIGTIAGPGGIGTLTGP